MARRNFILLWFLFFRVGSVLCPPSSPIKCTMKLKARILVFNIRVPITKGFMVSFLLPGIERFSYDLEMKTREQNRNNNRTEIERFDWFIERIQTRVAFGWLSKRSRKKTSCPRTF